MPEEALFVIQKDKEESSALDGVFPDVAQVTSHADPICGVTALHLAGQLGQVDLATLLVKSGADKSKKDKYNRTPRDACAPGSSVLSSFYEPPSPPPPAAK